MTDARIMDICETLLLGTVTLPECEALLTECLQEIERLQMPPTRQDLIDAVRNYQSQPHISSLERADLWSEIIGTYCDECGEQRIGRGVFCRYCNGE